MGSSVEIGWTGVRTRVEMKSWVSGGNFGTRVEFVFLLRIGDNWCGTSVETRCLWWVVEVGCAVEGRGRFVRGVCGN